tara:strand:+ start:430 stop:1653 length:1224 start_codon:yes stop_codon:yes gene_type:complete
MADIALFKAIRPIRDKVHLVATRPYYSYKKNVLKAKLQDNPYTFLRIINPEFNSDIKTKPNSDERFKLVGQKYREFIEKGILIEEDSPRLYIYRQTTENHSCIGVIGGASIKEYLSDEIKKHEATLTTRESMFTRYLEIVGYNAEPVLISYKGNNTLNESLTKLTEERPEYEFSTTDQIKHELWILSEEHSKELQEHFKTIPCSYIADGHHRSASSARLYQKNENTFPESNYFLSYFVEEKQLRILEFNRLVKTLNGLTKDEFIQKISLIGELEKLTKISKPSHEHHIHFFIEEQWYKLTLSNQQINKNNPVKCLDSSILTDLILHPILGIEDLKTSREIDFLPGIFSIEEFHSYARKNEFKIGFVLFPIEVNQIKKVADHGLNMPPKSTWVEPKLRSGLTIYKINI